jgi:site-specific recombinase XerD
MPPVRRGTSADPLTLTLAQSANTRRTHAARAQAHIQDPEQVLARYLTWHEAEGHSRKTEEDYQKTLRPFFAYLKNEHGLTDLGALELDHLRAWLVWLRNTPTPHGRPRSSKTIESYCRQMMAFVRWCVAEGILDHDPTARPSAARRRDTMLSVFRSQRKTRVCISSSASCVQGMPLPVPMASSAPSPCLVA